MRKIYSLALSDKIFMILGLVTDETSEVFFAQCVKEFIKQQEVEMPSMNS